MRTYLQKQFQTTDLIHALQRWDIPEHFQKKSVAYLQGVAQQLPAESVAKSRCYQELQTYTFGYRN